MLIVSLPPVHQEDLLRQIITHPCVGAVRLNTGMRMAAFSPDEVIRKIQTIAGPIGKPVHIDLKSKQLRIIQWARLPDGPILLNHKIKVDGPAKVYFRGDSKAYDLKVVDGNEIYVDPIPREVIGEGQSINIVASKLLIEGGLTDLDHEYIRAGLKYRVRGFMLSFVENVFDIKQFTEILKTYCIGTSLTWDDFEICLKIESKKGLNFVRGLKKGIDKPLRLMAARDDLMIHIGVENMPAALKQIIKKDPGAICASRLFMGLEVGAVSMADVSDFEYMKLLGYKDFMLSDWISREHFPEAIQFWHDYKHNKGL